MPRFVFVRADPEARRALPVIVAARRVVFAAREAAVRMLLALPVAVLFARRTVFAVALLARFAAFDVVFTARFVARLPARAALALCCAAVLAAR